jgi:hypothetical protein
MIEEKQFHPGGIPGKKAEIDTSVSEGGAQGRASPFFFSR